MHAGSVSRAAMLLAAISLLTLGCRDSGKTPATSAGGGASEYAPNPVGTPITAIDADGWLNAKAPAWSSLRGKVVVLDCWAYW